MTPAEIAGLAERCEREGPSRALDVEIERLTRTPTVATFPIDQGRGGDYWLDERGGEIAHSAPVTASLDAAVRFVERVLPSARHGYEQEPDRSFFATIRPTHDRVTQRHQHGQAATPALALVAAALRALAARDGGGA